MAHRTLPRGLRFAHLHVRLLISVAVFAVVLAGLAVLAVPPAWLVSTRVLIAWDMAAGLYLALAFVMMARPDVDVIRRRAEAQDEGAGFILVAAVAAASVCVTAIFLELAHAKKTGDHAFHTSLAVAAILLSWLFTHTIFALHYAHEYYRQGERGSGLKFPGNAPPDYTDFMYFSLVIGMTSQVSDVVITGRPIRRTALAHGVFSFLFNTTIIALTVNIASGVV